MQRQKTIFPAISRCSTWRANNHHNLTVRASKRKGRLKESVFPVAAAITNAATGNGIRWSCCVFLKGLNRKKSPKTKTNKSKLTSAVKSWGALKKKNYTSSKLLFCSTAVLVFVGLQTSFTLLNYMITIKQPWCQVLYTVKGQLGVPHLYPVTI